MERSQKKYDDCSDYRDYSSYSIDFCSEIRLNIMETKRFGFKMRLLPGFKDEYKKRHSQIWPELLILLKNEGVGNYSIFLDEDTNTLFAYQEQSGESSSQDLGNTEIVKKWWKYMADIMETNPDNSPVTIPLEQVFYME
jgi:L-rhamnose mutarotase